LRFSTFFRLLQTWLPFVVVFAVGAYLRLYRIGEMPPGLYRDEGFYGLDALRVLRGEFALYFAANNGREGLFIYLLALGVGVFGRTPEALRIVSACVGIATVVALYFAGRNLFSHRIGVLSAGILAITLWHVAISRVAYRAITLPLLLCIFVALAAATLTTTTSQARKPARLITAFLAGVAFGLTFYTYTSGQFLLWLVLALVLIELATALRNHQSLIPNPQSLLPALLGSALALAPFAFWLIQHSDLYFARAGQVSILNPAINKGDFFGTLLGNIGKAAGMFFVEGDRIWRHNLSRQPVFEGALALSFLVGVVVCVWKGKTDTPQFRFAFRLSPFAIVLLWLLIFLIPTLLAEDTPHFLRGIGALPAACLVCAIGLEWALGQASRRGLLMVTGRISRWLSPPAVLAAVLLTFSGVKTYNDYFTLYANQPITSYWLEHQNVAMAHAINRFAAQRPNGTVLVQAHLANNNASLQFLSPIVEQGRIFLPPENPTQWQPIQWKPSSESDSERDANYWLLILDPTRDWQLLRNALPPDAVLKFTEGPLAQNDFDPQPHTSFIAIEITKRLSQGVDRARFDKGIRLSFADQHCNPQAPEACAVALTWRSLQPIPNDYAVFVHWMRDGKLIDQHDSSPGAGYWPMPFWRPGDLVADEFTLRVPGGGKPFDEVHVGIYDRATGTRLNVLDANGNPIGNSVIILPPR
jgi:4-amino-4-deoxy-L-arabinose transferase-like glycosyltransferase